MSDPILYSQLEPNETLADADIMPVEQPASGGLRRQKGAFLSALKTFFTSGIKNGTEQLNPRSFTSGRFDSQELASGSLSVSGWYTIAETEDAVGLISSSEFKVTDIGGGILGCLVSVAESSNAKTHINSTIKLLETASNTTGTVNQVKSFRLAKSAVNGAGFKLQTQLAPSSARVFYIQMSKNFSRSTGKGWQLVTPYLDNTPTLPDGVTAGTFLEAGEELSFENSDSRIYSNFSGFAVSNDALRTTVQMTEIPKQGTGITITLPATSLIFIDGQGNTATVSGAHSITNLVITGKILTFNIVEVGVFSSLNLGLSVAKITGTGGKLTIT